MGRAKRREPEIRPVFGGLTEQAHQQAGMFRNRLLKRAHHLRKWPAKGITCYRLYDRDIPEVPLAVDTYEGRLHLAEYDRPHDRSPGEHADWLDLMVRTAAEALDVKPADCFLKCRRRQRGLSQYERHADDHRAFVVGEGGLKFQVNLSDYLDTGLFLDHRITRSMVRDEAGGKTMLNLFAYTGSFSVYAAAGGAKATTSVDLSNTYLDWARQNMAINGHTGRQHEFVRGDAMSFLRAHGEGPAYELAVVDVPTYSNSKSTEEDWDVQQHHAALLNRLAELMPPGGVIYFSTNFRRFKLDEPALAGLQCREISGRTVPEDFRNKRIHRCWRMVKAGGRG
jgi:23S rRNA (guanine2445-N2)-methyltransferase / 23S rRNA (guanine2069-N7)-methyltransferase